MDDHSLLSGLLLPSRIERLTTVAAGRTRTLTVLLDGVHDRHNLSAVARSCEGFGLLEMFVVESHGRTSINRKITQGVDKWLTIHRFAEPAGCIAALRARGFAIWAADPQAGKLPLSLDDLPFDFPVALAFGSEHDGLSAEVLRAAAGRFHIPMFGFVQSFNISVAAGIALAIAVRVRARRPQGHADLSSAEQRTLVDQWQFRSVRHADRILSHLTEARRRRGDDP